MERRALLKMIAAATGMALIGNNVWAATSNMLPNTTNLFKKTDLALLDEIAETILPRTDLPGAKDAGCGAQMQIMVQDCYTPEQQELFIHGLVSLQQLSHSQFGAEFGQLTAEQRTRLLTQLDTEAKASNAVLQSNDSTNASNRQGDPTAKLHYFTLFKQLSIFVFFTSKVGATEVLRYVAVPGRYDGAFPYKKGDKTWALW